MLPFAAATDEMQTHLSAASTTSSNIGAGTTEIG